MNKKQKKNLTRIIISTVLMIILHFLPLAGLPRFAAYLLPYLIVGYDVLIKAWKGVLKGHGMDECFLMAVATIGAFVLAVISSGDYTEAVAVMLFYQIGEFFQDYAVDKSRRNIADLMDIRPDYANIESDGKLTKVDPYEVEVGSTIVVLPGEKVPLDGIVSEGNSTLDTAALTGESIPKEVFPGDDIISGSINLNKVLKVTTTREFDESTASKIIELVEDSGSRKSKYEAFITKFARIYTPAVVYSAIALAVIPPLFQTFILHSPGQWSNFIYRALTFLVISCPCALVVSIPLSFFSGIGAASRCGILVKGSNFMEILSNTRYVAFDKTGTLTKGIFEVDGIHHSTMEDKKILRYAALVESASFHPIADSLKRAYGESLNLNEVSDIEEFSGKGITGIVDGHKIAVGNDKLMEYLNIKAIPCHHTGTIIHISSDGEYLGHIVISDQPKENSAEAVELLHRIGVKRTIMLTGDSKKIAEKIASELKIDSFVSQLLPADKVKEVEKLLSEKSSPSEVLAFVGDGINDAPVLARSDIGIAMGAIGSDAAIEAADIILMDDDPLKIPLAIKISKKCLSIVRENIVFSLGVKGLCLILGAFGIANLWLAVFADVGVMLLAVLNSVRALSVRK
ncbi:heavy metal translocating P-type ATPase [Lachnospiraceae bacterium C1.1]|nr:heavy metal translocating P-type ATPase [Lachnospiraceae bacterium C1.1]